MNSGAKRRRRSRTCLPSGRKRLLSAASRTLAPAHGRTGTLRLEPRNHHVKRRPDRTRRHGRRSWSGSDRAGRCHGAAPQPRPALSDVRRRGGGSRRRRRPSRTRRAHDDHPRAGVDPHGRQAEPGPAQGPPLLVHVDGHRGGEEGRGRRRRLGRQHRRADGDGQDLPAHHGGRRPSRARGALADRARPVRRARSRRLHRRRRAASRRSRHHGRGAGAASCWASSVPPSACSMSASRRSRASRK